MKEVYLDLFYDFHNKRLIPYTFEVFNKETTKVDFYRVNYDIEWRGIHISEYDAENEYKDQIVEKKYEDMTEDYFEMIKPAYRLLSFQFLTYFNIKGLEDFKFIEYI